jgi:hypothetical protein
MRFSWRSDWNEYKVRVKREKFPVSMEAAIKRRSEMKKLIVTLAAVLAMPGAANAASIINRDGAPVTVIVTEGADQVNLDIGSGETVEFCAGGCFITFNGDRQVLTGAETVEISGNALTIN